MPPPGHYWVTAPGPLVRETFFEHLLPGRDWSYVGVTAYWRRETPDGVDLRTFLDRTPAGRKGRPEPYVA